MEESEGQVNMYRNEDLAWDSFVWCWNPYNFFTATATGGRDFVFTKERLDSYLCSMRIYKDVST